MSKTEDVPSGLEGSVQLHLGPKKASESWSGTTRWQAKSSNGLGFVSQQHRQIKRIVRYPR